MDRSIAYRLSFDSTGITVGSKRAVTSLRAIGTDGVDFTAKKLRGLSSTAGGVETVGQKLEGLHQSAVKNRDAWRDAGAMTAGFGTGIALTLGASVKAAMSWQSQFAGVRKTVSGTASELDGLEGGLRNLASTALPASHEQLASVAEAAGQLGIKTKNILGFTKTMIDMGEATNLTADQAATEMARFSNIMGTPQENIFRLGAAIVGLGNNFATTESEIMDMGMRIAGAGKQAHMSEGDVLGFATALSSVGIDAEAGGTAISMVMKKIGNSVDDGGKSVDEFARIAGMSSADFQKAWGDDSAGAMQKFIAGLGDAQAKGENVNKALSELGITGIRESDALLRLSSASDVLKNALATGNGEYIKGIALMQEAEKRYATAESRVKIMGNSIRDAAIDFGDVLLPAVADTADGLADLAKWFKDLPEPVKQLTVGLGGTAGAAAIAAGGFLTLAPKIFDVVDGFKTLSREHPNVVSNLGSLGKTAGVLAAAFATAQVAGAAFSAMVDTSSRSASEMTNRLVNMQKGLAPGDTANTILDPTIWDEANGFWTSTGPKITNWGEAIETSNQKLNKWADSLMGVRSSATITSDTIAATDQSLQQLASGGAQDTAAEGFTKIAKEAEAQGVSLHDLMAKFPEYTSYLDQVATAAGLTADDQTRLKLATGEITPEMIAAGASTDDAAKKLQGLGIDAKTSKQELSDLADEIRGFGSAELNADAAHSAWEQSIDDATAALKKNGETLDLTTEKGRDNDAKLRGMIESNKNWIGSMIETGHSSKEVQKAMASQRKTIIKMAEDMGMGADQAKAYADRLMMTPEEVKTRLEVRDRASGKIKNAQGKADKFGGSKPTAHLYADTSNATAKVDKVEEYIKSKNWKVTLWIYQKIKGNPQAQDPKEEQARQNGRNYRFGIGRHKATGGEVRGPGTETSDSIPAMLSDNEHVWTAKEVRGAGGHTQVEKLRALAAAGALPAFKSGGRVGSAQHHVDELQKELTRARRRKQDSHSKAAKRRATADVRRLEDEIRSARARLKGAKADEAAAEKARKAAEERRKAEAERRGRVNELRGDLRKDIRRGDVRESVTGGLSSAYGVVDRLAELGRNKDLSRGARARASRDARAYESSLRSLYRSLDRVQKKTESAQKRLEDLKSIQSSVASSISGNAYKLDVTENWAQDSKGRWQQTKGVSGARKNAAAAAKRVRDLAQKINRLQKMGYSGAILQEIATAGSIDESTAMADALLKGSKSDVRSLNASYKDIEKYSQQAGKYVTGGFYKGGVDAAAGLVKGLQSQEKQINRTISRIAKGMEKALKRTLGIHSPSTVMRGHGRDTGRGYWMGIDDEAAATEKASGRLALAAVPDTLAVGYAAQQSAIATAAQAAPASSSLFAQLAAVPAPATGSSSLFAAPQAQPAGPASGAGGAPSEDPDAVADRWDAITGTTDEALSAMQAKTAAAYAQMTTDTDTSLQARSETTTTQMDAMSTTQADTLSGMQATHLATLQAMHKDQTKALSNMKDTNASDYEAIRSTGTGKIASMRKTIGSTMGGLHEDYKGKLKDLNRLNSKGMGNVEAAGRSAFAGIRSGMNKSMGDARPDLGGKVNRLIGVLGRFTGSVNKAFKDVGVKLPAPKPIKYATGGVMPGYTPGRDVHHFRSPSAGDLYLSGGEAIMRPEFTRAVGGEAGIKRLNKAARSGDLTALDAMLPHEYATGGVFPHLGPIRGLNAFADSGVWRGLWSIVKRQFPGITLHSAYRQGAITASGNRSYHSRGMAVDIDPSMKVFQWLRSNFGRSNEIIYSPANGAQIKDGHNHLYSGAVRRMHYNHIHWANRTVPGMKGGAPMPFDPDTGEPLIPPFLDKAGIKTYPGDMTKAYRKAAGIHADRTIKALAPQVAGLHNPFTEAIARSIFTKAKAGLVKKAGEAGKNMGGGNYKASENMEYWRPLVARALAISGAGGGRADENAWLRQIMSESSGNPKLIQSPAVDDINVQRGDPARGLVQIPGVTWADFGKGMGPFIPNVYDPLKNLVVGMRQAAHDYHPWQATIGHGHGYATGTESAVPGWKWVGEEGPELVRFHGGEKVRDARKSLTVENQVVRGQTSVALAPDSVDQLKAAVAAQLSAGDLAGVLDGVQLTLVADGQQMSAHIMATVNRSVEAARTSIDRGSSMIGAR